MTKIEPIEDTRANVIIFVTVDFSSAVTHGPQGRIRLGAYYLNL